jgi:cobalt-zinc-cadmium efflux system outer membrane protein
MNRNYLYPKLVSLWTLILGAQCAQAAFTVTLDQAIALADQNNPQIQASVAQIGMLTGGVLTARAYPNPEAGVLAGRQTARVPGAVPGFSSAYTFAQPLELGPLRPARIQYAARGVESGEIALAETRLAVLAGVRRAFFQVLHRKGEIEISTESLRLVEDLRQRIQVRVDVGEAGRLELVRAEAEVASARTQANSAQLELITAISQFRSAVGAPLDPDLEFQGKLDDPPTLPSLDELRAEAIENHPALQLARSEVRRAESRIEYEKALKRPQPAIVSQIEIAPDNPTYRAGIAIGLPFWNRREGPIAEASAALRQVNSLAQARQIEILSALEGAFSRYKLAGEQIAAFEQGFLREAGEALRAAETAYQLGERGIVEVLDAQRVLRSVRLNFLNAQYQRQAALIDLDELRAVDLRRNTP